MTDIRWKQRFWNFEKAYLLLKEGLDLKIVNLSKLEKEGVIQRFEYTYELGWKTLKDYLEYQGIKVSLTRDTIKEAFAAQIIDNGQAWIDMLEDRNLTSHTFDEAKTNEILEKIDNIYFNEIMKVYNYLKGKIDE
jgi:nucleotidyltransferase substrate binding protein (TIGR01987 family)